LISGKLSIYLPSLRGGGAERVMVLLANGFAERGIATDLVLANAEGPYLAEVSPNVRVIDLGASRVIRSLPGLARYLRRERPLALLSALNHANVIACLAHRLAGVPTRLVVSEHNHLSLSIKTEPSRRGRLMHWFMRYAYPWADGVVAVSAGVADDLARVIALPHKSITVIYNPVVGEQTLSRANAEVDHPWFAPGEPPVVLGVGRLTDQKDFSALLRAFGRLRAQRCVRLLILGEGELRPQLEALVRKLDLEGDVQLPGFIANPFAYMARAAVLVLSSKWEGLPTVLIEAMACGTPVVSTDCPSGPAEILEGGKWGRLAPVGDAEALAEAMLATLAETQHPDVAHRARDFGVDRAVDEYLRVLQGNRDAQGDKP